VVVYNEKGIVSVNTNDSRIPTGFILYQNYPNPFNPETTIEYEITNTERAKVQVKIFDMQGKLVNVIVDERLNPGIHEAKFNGEGMPSGIYFYSLSVNGELKETKKMVLLK
jgi:hypothetical protein